MSISTNNVRRLDKIILPGGTFTQLSDVSWDSVIQDMMEHPAGEIAPTFQGNESEKPVVNFTTSQLDVALSQIGTIGAAPGAVDTYFKVANKTGNVARANTVHDLIRLNDALLYLESFRLPHQGVGTARVILVALYNGTNNPFVYSTGVALVSTMAANDFWGAGPVKINGSLVGGVKEISYQSGIRLTREGGENEQWDTFVGIEQCDPQVDITTLNKVNWGGLGLAGTALDGANGLEFYARKHGPAGPVATGTAQHIYFQGLRGVAKPVTSSGQGTSPVSDQLRVKLSSPDGSTAWLTGTTASAIV